MGYRFDHYLENFHTDIMEKYFRLQRTDAFVSTTFELTA